MSIRHRMPRNIRLWGPPSKPPRDNVLLKLNNDIHELRKLMTHWTVRLYQLGKRIEALERTGKDA